MIPGGRGAVASTTHGCPEGPEIAFKAATVAYRTVIFHAVGTRTSCRANAASHQRLRYVEHGFHTTNVWRQSTAPTEAQKGMKSR